MPLWGVVSGREVSRHPSRRRELSGGCCPSFGASNYDSVCASPCIATGFGCCVFEVSGCTESVATNYLASATADSGLCAHAVAGCTVSVRGAK